MKMEKTEGRETMNKMYCVGENVFSIKRKHLGFYKIIIKSNIK